MKQTTIAHRAWNIHHADAKPPTNSRTPLKPLTCLAAVSQWFGGNGCPLSLAGGDLMWKKELSALSGSRQVKRLLLLPPPPPPPPPGRMARNEGLTLGDGAGRNSPAGCPAGGQGNGKPSGSPTTYHCYDFLLPFKSYFRLLAFKLIWLICNTFPSAQFWTLISLTLRGGQMQSMPYHDFLVWMTPCELHPPTSPRVAVVLKRSSKPGSQLR